MTGTIGRGPGIRNIHTTWALEFSFDCIGSVIGLCRESSRAGVSPQIRPCPSGRGQLEAGTGMRAGE